MAASAIDLDVSMDYLEPDDDDSSFDDENFNPNQKAKKTSGGKVAGAVTKTTTKQTTTTTKPTTATASQKTIEQTYQKKTQLEVRFGPHLTIYFLILCPRVSNSYNS